MGQNLVTIKLNCFMKPLFFKIEDSSSTFTKIITFWANEKLEKKTDECNKKYIDRLSEIGVAVEGHCDIDHDVDSECDAEWQMGLSSDAPVEALKLLNDLVGEGKLIDLMKPIADQLPKKEENDPS